MSIVPLCSASGDGWRCDKPTYIKELCPGHYQQQRKGKPLKKLRFYPSQRKARKKVERHDPQDFFCRVPEGYKRCNGCGLTLPIKEFCVQSASLDGHKDYCRACDAAKFLDWRRGKGAAAWKQQRLEEQGHKCEICGSPNPHHRYGFQLDHDHETGAWRGVLCKPCNIALGEREKHDWDLEAFAANFRGYLARVKSEPKTAD